MIKYTRQNIIRIKKREEKMEGKYTNPICAHGADPWVVKQGGKYYYCYAHRGVHVSCADNIHLISEREGKRVYLAPEGTMYSKEYWAPELHFIRGRWYIYVAADDGDNYNHRMYCLRALTDDPMGEYEMVGKISDATDKWAIDATVWQYGDRLFFIWSGWEGDINVEQDLYIAEMSEPTTISSARVRISRPEYEWEKRSCGGDLPTVNEGPAILEHGGVTHLIYSASGSWSDDYCLGMLTFRGGDPLDPKCWIKSGKPVFSKADGAFGPGHCSFVKSPSGEDDYVVYHANLVSGSSWGGRSVRVQKITWDGDLPVFGVPAAPGEELDIPE